MSKNKSFSQLLKESELPVLVDFYAEWCGPCKAMAPTLSQFAKENSDKIKVIKVNVDKNQAASQQYSIRSIPTLILFKKGKIAWRQAGALNLQQMNQMLASNL